VTTGQLEHGVTVLDAALMCGVSQGTVRSWLSRYDLARTADGQIDPFALLDWWDNKRDTKQAKCRGWKIAA
jgi:hypothetical protein